MSNILVVQLPLDTSSITLPPPEQRVIEQEEAYLEYIEVLEGSGYLPEMDGRIHFLCELYFICSLLSQYISLLIFLLFGSFLHFLYLSSIHGQSC